MVLFSFFRVPQMSEIKERASEGAGVSVLAHFSFGSIALETEWTVGYEKWKQSPTKRIDLVPAISMYHKARNVMIRICFCSNIHRLEVRTHGIRMEDRSKKNTQSTKHILLDLSWLICAWGYPEFCTWDLDIDCISVTSSWRLFIPERAEGWSMHFISLKLWILLEANGNTEGDRVTFGIPIAEATHAPEVFRANGNLPVQSYSYGVINSPWHKKEHSIRKTVTTTSKCHVQFISFPCGSPESGASFWSSGCDLGQHVHSVQLDKAGTGDYGNCSFNLRASQKLRKSSNVQKRSGETRPLQVTSQLKTQQDLRPRATFNGRVGVQNEEPLLLFFGLSFAAIRLEAWKTECHTKSQKYQTIISIAVLDSKWTFSWIRTRKKWLIHRFTKCTTFKAQKPRRCGVNEVSHVSSPWIRTFIHITSQMW